MRFVKMHGIGNDYIYMDSFRAPAPVDPSALAVRMSRPHFGVGADGLILIEPSDTCDARMRVFNADGSEARMCGNGIRCVGKYLYDSGLRRKRTLRIDTLSGVKVLALLIEGDTCVGATVDMGEPTLSGDVVRNAAGRDWLLTRVSIGNPHAVTVVSSMPQDDLFFAAGPLLERDSAFPGRANIEFVRIADRAHLIMRVWERGSGETLACGTGACAALVACASKDLCARKATVSLAGGDLTIDWREDNHVYMTGPAVTAFTGEWPDENK